MFPLTHPLLAYVLYSWYARRVTREPPTDGATRVLVAAAVLPDLVDGPLAMATDIPSSRTVAHSLLVAVPLVVLVWLVLSRCGHDDVASAFAIGYLSHPLADAIYPLLVCDVSELGFLLWPITDSPPYDGQKPLATVVGVDVTTVVLEVLIGTGALLAWYRDGMPGVPMTEFG